MTPSTACSRSPGPPRPPCASGTPGQAPRSPRSSTRPRAAALLPVRPDWTWQPAWWEPNDAIHRYPGAIDIRSLALDRSGSGSCAHSVADGIGHDLGHPASGLTDGRSAGRDADRLRALQHSDCKKGRQHSRSPDLVRQRVVLSVWRDGVAIIGLIGLLTQWLADGLGLGDTLSRLTGLVIATKLDDRGFGGLSRGCVSRRHPMALGADGPNATHVDRQARRGCGPHARVTELIRTVARHPGAGLVSRSAHRSRVATAVARITSADPAQVTWPCPRSRRR